MLEFEVIKVVFKSGQAILKSVFNLHIDNERSPFLPNDPCYVMEFLKM